MSDRIPESPFREVDSPYPRLPRRTGPRNPFATALMWAWMLAFGAALLLMLIRWIALHTSDGVDTGMLALMDSWTVDLLRLGFVALFAHLCAKAVLWKAP